MNYGLQYNVESEWFCVFNHLCEWNGLLIWLMMCDPFVGNLLYIFLYVIDWEILWFMVCDKYLKSDSINK